ncbi:capsule biosynthesis GfcC family protein [Stenotrophomonas lactitubi]|uniref:capsule biosynthesis GfcC family protein n=1 Tax=Stenotrophomonas lactitubi TaxID=2045214 RepID=UPI000FBFABF8|nr:capsule biosynthesis GfcC family protein [Stenotrophomonas lactitubi]
MTLSKPRRAAIALLLVGGAVNAAELRIDGAVNAAGIHSLPANARLADAMLLAQPRSDAYMLGASFQQQQARESQLRLRAGLRYGVEQLATSSDAEVAGAAHALGLWLDSHPATGRVPIAGSARLIQVQPPHNPLLASGDALHVPLQPRSVQVMGAVGKPCTLPHAAQRDARDYLRDCQPNSAADPNEVYVIQPDGRVQRLGIALWNRADPQAIAPGGSLFVPLRASVLKPIDPLFNSDFAAFIATQPVSP